MVQHIRQKSISGKFRVLILILAGFGLFAGACRKYDNPPVAMPVPAPQLVSFDPAEGPMGFTVVLNGANFSSSLTGNTVTFNGKTAIVSAATSNRLTVTVPAGAGDGKIAVQTGGQTVTSATGFTYLYTVSTFAGSSPPAYLDGAGAVAKFHFPFGVATDAAGNIIITDLNNQRIRSITPAGVVSTVAGDGLQGFINGAGVDARFREPFAAAADASGTIFIADVDNNMIRKITLSGEVSTLAGDTIQGQVNATGTAARFSSPSGVAVDGAGTIFVADADNHLIRKISQAGVVTTFAGDGHSGYKDAPGTEAEFNYPSGIALDGSGNVYVADESNNMIRKITPAGMVSTLAGNLNSGHQDGNGREAGFNSPIAMTVDRSGNVYVGDYNNQLVRKITPSGVVTTIAGDGSPGFKDGVGRDAQFRNPAGIAIGASGIIYVADFGNHRIRSLQ
ncbi:IPT/TIG domain-containing protein [Flavitalea flava]